MKTVNTDLGNYLDNEKHFLTCDLYMLRLADGTTYYVADSDIDITWNNHLWEHNRGLFSRDQTKLSGEPSVDSMTVNIICDHNDKIKDLPMMQACHNGLLDDALLTIYKVYFYEESVVGGFPLFSGNTEVSQAGGLKIKLVVKGLAQGLSTLVPIRIFAPQEAYTNINGTISITDNTDNVTMMIPLKPSNRVLIKV